MSSIPPKAHAYEARPRIALCPSRLALSCRDEAAVCFAIEGADFGQTRSIPEADGGLFIETTILGRVEGVERDTLVIVRGNDRARVRYLLPSAIDLSPLLGEVVEVTVGIRFSAERRPTIDAIVRDETGRPWLWARDGKLPADQPPRPVVRLAHTGGSPRLAFAHMRGLVTVAPADLVELETTDGPARAVAVRIEDEDVGFVVLWS